RKRPAMSPDASRNSVRSWPTQKPRPAPVSTTALTSGARASRSAPASARCIAVLNALRTSGRVRGIVGTPPSILVSTSATRELSQMAQRQTPLLAWLHGALLHLDAV